MDASKRPFACNGLRGVTICHVSADRSNIPIWSIYATYLQTWAMSKKRFRTLGMVVSTVSHCRARCTDCQSTNVKLVTGTVSVLGGFIYNLIVIYKSKYLFESWGCPNGQINVPDRMRGRYSLQTGSRQ